jgi:hypothetical protein
MTLACDDLKAILSSFSLVVSCDKPAEGLLRIATPFQYPDGSLIDVFLDRDSPLFPDGYILSDYGQTALQLLHFSVKPSDSVKQSQAVADICDSLGVHFARGTVYAGLEADELKTSLPAVVVRLVQACIRISGLYLTARPRQVSTFRDEVKEHILQAGWQAEGPVKLIGVHGEPVSVDIRVRGPHKPALIQTLSAKDEKLPHPRSNEVFASWYELKEYQPENQFVTVVEDKISKARQDDIGRLNDFSEIVYFPRDHDRLRSLLAA